MLPPFRPQNTQFIRMSASCFSVQGNVHAILSCLHVFPMRRTLLSQRREDAKNRKEFSAAGFLTDSRLCSATWCLSRDVETAQHVLVEGIRSIFPHPVQRHNTM